MSLVSNNPYGISLRTIERGLKIQADKAHPSVKIHALHNELDRVGLEPQDQAFLNILLARLLLIDPKSARVDKSAFGRGEEGAEVTIGRHPSTTALLAAASAIRLVGIRNGIYDRLCQLAFNPREEEVRDIFTLLSQQT